MKIQQVVNTVEVKTLTVIQKTMQGEKVDPDDDQSGKDSVFSRRGSSEFRKSHSKCRTRKEQPKFVHLQDRIQQRTVEQVENIHDQYDINAVKMEQSTTRRLTMNSREQHPRKRCQAKWRARRLHQT